MVTIQSNKQLQDFFFCIQQSGFPNMKYKPNNLYVKQLNKLTTPEFCWKLC